MVALHFHKPFSLQGRLVRLWTRSDWIHVGIAHEVEGLPVVTEATLSGGVVVRRLQYARPPDAVIEIPWLSESGTTAYLSAYWGAAYGLRDVLGFVTGSRHNFGGVQCAELVALLCATAIPFCREAEPGPTYEPLKALLLNTLPSRVSPAALARALGLH